MNKPITATMTASETTARTHLLQSKPETVHWGYFDGGLPPVLTIESGDRVTIECVSGNPEWMPPAGSPFEPLDDIKLIHEKVKRGSGNHILTGPIAVNGAKIGDVLEVRILDIAMRQDWGFNLFRSYGGTLPEDFNYYRIIHVGLDRTANLGIMPSGLKVPLAPFFGQLAVAPPKDFGKQNSKEPREFGGNIDCKDLTAGSTIYLPVWNDGALFSTGDGHAAQGHGEVDGTAIETSLTGTFEFHVRKDLGWKSAARRDADASHRVRARFRSRRCREAGAAADDRLGDCADRHRQGRGLRLVQHRLRPPRHADRQQCQRRACHAREIDSAKASMNATTRKPK